MAIEIKIFELPMCCSSGMCGPTVDERLVDFNTLIDRLKNEGYLINRYMLTNDRDKFISEPKVMSLIKDEQMEALPLVMVDGKIIKKGDYPTYDEIIAAVKA
ncbi:MAG TPA: arsenite efflux transporter metallochaperone ArsD [Actinobacteria bacterium]|nr:arsenite efflux transporter metallochaperone ArsD [Actinomycetes bacterium]HEX21080.1 arsenite efflux transporter metallochaperone ArsD [Actinomycetota bacterium]